MEKRKWERIRSLKMKEKMEMGVLESKNEQALTLIRAFLKNDILTDYRFKTKIN